MDLLHEYQETTMQMHDTLKKKDASVDYYVISNSGEPLLLINSIQRCKQLLKA